MFNFQLYPVTSLGCGSLNVMCRPNPGELLEDALASLVKAGIDCVVSLLQEQEAFELALEREGEVCRRFGMKFLSHPIPDHSVPEDVESYLNFVRRLHGRIRGGEQIAIHCYAGIGRTGLTAGSILVVDGYEVDDAFALVSRCRGFPVPDTEEQRQWLYAHQHKLAPA